MRYPSLLTALIALAGLPAVFAQWTAPCWSRKWMSGHADALAQSATDRQRQIVQKLVGPTAALQKTLPSAGEVLFSLDKPLSWVCHPGCFEAGRFTQTQSSWTAPRCSRKWMSGHAGALAQSVTDRKRQIVVLLGPITALQETLPSAGNVSACP